MIVLVDDDKDTREMARQMLEIDGFDVADFDAGTAALEFLKSNHENVEAVLLDLSMPVMEGLTTGELIRLNEATYLHEPPLKLAYYTARNIDDAIERVASRCGVERIFRKPHDTQNLASHLTEWLSKGDLARC